MWIRALCFPSCVSRLAWQRWANIKTACVYRGIFVLTTGVCNALLSSSFDWRIAECPTIPISSGLSRFCLKIPNPDQYAIGIRKIPISSHVVIFSSNSHKRKRNAEYLTLMSRKTEETARNCRRFLTEIVMSEHQKWHFRASRFKNFLGGMPPDPSSKRRLRRLTEYLSENFIPI